ncbi:MAG: hypothetical protein A3D28_05995 [Omnitrophica bacterium RIFCSPHIGHO2_02_FULL_63_14]|nr:MAG: hypothetical protein A3D28_05995 [Omnitrophica bacterium RIFCSPHIGHO2_02_FULL_63_14]
MPDIRGFRGWRYHRAAVGDIAKVVAPPYDVISPKERERLHRLHPANVVRLILGKEGHARAGTLFRDWMDRGVLRKETLPALYVYTQEYREGARKKTRVGFMAAMRIDEKAVLKHENTLAAPKKDRLALIRRVKANLSPVFGLFEDPAGSVQLLLKKTLRRKPTVAIRVAGVRHRLYAETRPGIVEAVSRLMRSKPVFIADGHHRFEVACRYSRMNPAAGRVMMYFSDFRHNPFTIYPTHRLIRTTKDPIAVLSKYGKLNHVGARHAVPLRVILKTLSKPRRRSDKQYRFGIYSKKHGFYLFTLGPKYSSRVKDNPVDRLDVAVLHQFVIAPCFGVRAVAKSRQIDFTRDPEETVRKVRSGEFDLALFLRPASLGEMVEASKQGLKMPQKSTYFYPKLLSGLVFHVFD